MYIDMDGIFYADPAWPAAMPLPYPTQTINRIRDMPVEHIFKKGVCFLWVTNAYLEDGIDIMRKWGYN